MSHLPQNQDARARQLGLPEVRVVRPGVRRAVPRPRYRRFLKGPVPWPWLLAASRLGGKALNVGLAIWQKRGITGDPVVLSLSRLEMGFDRSTASRALVALERAGLVRVERAPGHAPRISVVDDEGGC